MSLAGVLAVCLWATVSAVQAQYEPSEWPTPTPVALPEAASAWRDWRSASSDVLDPDEAASGDDPGPRAESVLSELDRILAMLVDLDLVSEPTQDSLEQVRRADSVLSEQLQILTELQVQLHGPPRKDRLAPESALPPTRTIDDLDAPIRKVAWLGRRSDTVGDWRRLLALAFGNTAERERANELAKRIERARRARNAVVHTSRGDALEEARAAADAELAAALGELRQATASLGAIDDRGGPAPTPTPDRTALRSLLAEARSQVRAIQLALRQYLDRHD